MGLAEILDLLVLLESQKVSFELIPEQLDVGGLVRVKGSHFSVESWVLAVENGYLLCPFSVQLVILVEVVGLEVNLQLILIQLALIRGRHLLKLVAAAVFLEADEQHVVLLRICYLELMQVLLHQHLFLHLVRNEDTREFGNRAFLLELLVQLLVLRSHREQDRDRVEGETAVLDGLLVLSALPFLS